MAFSADEVRVLRRALAEALSPRREPSTRADGASGATRAATVVAPRPADHVRDCLRLATALDEAVREAGRLRTFLLDELRRYRAALPGAAAGYLERLTSALAAGYAPGADDLAALRGLRALPHATPQHHRRTATLLYRCETLAEIDVRQRLEAHMPAPRRLPTLPDRPPAPRRGGGAAGPADEPEHRPKPAPRPAPKPKPADPAPRPDPAAPRPQPKPRPDSPAPAKEPEREPGQPARPRTPTPAEIWPPRRREHKPDQARSA